jgi:2-polyprenyl-3-methyl-5-hydroxy-6-metoxy-1,4-benzoquinol methylase
MVFADTYATQADYDHYYQARAKYGGPVGTGAGQDPADWIRLGELAERLRPWLSHPEARVLDLGSGAGGLAAALQEKGYRQTVGLDPDCEAVAAATAKGLRVHEGLIHQAKTLLTGQRFDLIVLSHVAEHLCELSWFADLQHMLTPAGHVYIEVPNPMGYACGERPAYYYFDSEHINHFSLQALARLCRHAGLNLQAQYEVSLRLKDGTDYPSIAVVAGPGEGIQPACSRSTIEHVQAYVAESRRKASLPLMILPALADDQPLLVWGAGSWTQRLLGANLLPRNRMLAFLDSAPNKQGLTLDGLPILSPRQGLEQFALAPILVCVAIGPDAIAQAVEELCPGQARQLHFIHVSP